MVQYQIIYSWSETVIWTGDAMLLNALLFASCYFDGLVQRTGVMSFVHLITDFCQCGQGYFV